MNLEQASAILEKAGLPANVASIIGRKFYFEGESAAEQAGSLDQGFLTGTITAIRVFGGVVQLHTTMISAWSACWLQCNTAEPISWRLFADGTNFAGHLRLM